MNDEQFLLASAYVDGEITDDERRIAEADPAVMAEVERLRAFRSDLHSPAPASDDVREAAIAAAMAQFTASATPIATPTAAPPVATQHPETVVPYRPRPAYGKFLAVAAALVAVAGLGMVVSQSMGGDDDDGGDSATAMVESAEDTAESGGADDAGDGDDAGRLIESVTDFADSGGDDSEVAEEAFEAGDSDAADEAAAESADESTMDNAAAADDMAPAEIAPTVRVTVPSSFDPDQPIVDEFELAIFGADLLDREARGELGSTPNTACEIERILDRGRLQLGDETVDVYVAVSPDDDVVVAVDTTSCDVILVGELFQR